jgi:hypothetical protein
MEFDRSYDEPEELGNALVGDIGYAEADFHFSDGDGEERVDVDPDCLKPIGDLPMEPSPDSPRPPRYEAAAEAEPSLERGEITRLCRVKDPATGETTTQRVFTEQLVRRSEMPLATIGSIVAARGGGDHYALELCADTEWGQVAAAYNPRTKEGIIMCAHPHDDKSVGAEMAKAALDTATSLKSPDEAIVYVFGDKVPGTTEDAVDGLLDYLESQGLGGSNFTHGPSGRVQVYFSVNDGSICVVDQKIRDTTLRTKDKTFIDMVTGSTNSYPG